MHVDGAGTELHEETERRGASWAAVYPHDEVVIVGAAPALEEVEEEMFCAMVDVEVAGVDTGLAGGKMWRRGQDERAHLTVGSQKLEDLMRRV